MEFQSNLDMQIQHSTKHQMEIIIHQVDDPMVVDLTMGAAAWQPPELTAVPGGWPQPAYGSWMGRGGANYRYMGGGQLNAAGLHAVTFLLMAKECGVDVDPMVVFVAMVVLVFVLELVPRDLC